MVMIMTKRTSRGMGSGVTHGRSCCRPASLRRFLAPMDDLTLSPKKSGAVANPPWGQAS
jgi:hypothetical protein